MRDGARRASGAKARRDAMMIYFCFLDRSDEQDVVVRRDVDELVPALLGGKRVTTATALRPQLSMRSRKACLVL